MYPEGSPIGLLDRFWWWYDQGMVTNTRVRVEDYLALPEDGPPWLEYIDGEVVEKPVGSQTHGDIQAQFAFHLTHHQRRAGGRVKVDARSRFPDPGDPRFMLPDISFFRGGQRVKVEGMGVAPTFAIEIRSDGQSIEKQRERCRYYLAHGVEEAWLVDFDRHAIEVFDAERDGFAYVTGVVRSSSLRGFAISIEELFTGADDEWAPPAPSG